MQRLILLALTIVIGTLFMWYRPEGELSFVFNKTKLHADTYVYYVMEHLKVILLAIIIAGIEPKYRVAAIVFYIIAVADLVDFIFTYNSPWGNKYLTINTVGAGIFGLAIAYESWKQRRNE